MNDIGFSPQADEFRQFANVRYLWQKPTKTYRRAQVRFSQSTTYDFDGNHNRTNYELNGDINWLNNWWTEVGFGHKPRIFINTFLRGGPRWRYSDENFYFLFFGSDQRKKFNFTLGYVGNQAQQDNFSFQRYVVRMNYQPLNALSLSLSTEFSKNPNKTQYVTESSFGATPRYILGNIDQQTLSTTLRMNYSINPNLSIQYYGQPFISRGRYNDFNYVNNAVAEDLGERVTLYNSNQITLNNGSYLIDEDVDGTTDYSFGDPDFSFVQFRSNLVMRWEYIPGSEIFFVWSQGVTGLDDPRNSLRDALRNQISDRIKDNTFLIKFTYRFVK